MNVKQPILDIAGDADDLAVKAARRIAEAAQTTSGVFTLVLSGGSTPKSLYRRLSDAPFRSQIDWSKVEFFFGDERCVPPDHPDSNFRMADESLFRPLNIASQQIHRMKGEIDPQQAAVEYGQMLKTRFGDGGPDMVLLGMGDDGHTASLFPHTAALQESRHRCVANYVEKLRSWRITLTASFLNRSDQVLVLVAGAAKAQRLAEVQQGPRDPLRLPIQLIQPLSGRITWLLDAAAAGLSDPD